MTVVMAKHYIDNLSEETLKGMTEKARSGVYPSCAPVGYRNVEGPGGRRILVSDADAAPVITDEAIPDPEPAGARHLRAGCGSSDSRFDPLVLTLETHDALLACRLF
jgi:hypothetical protein